MSASEIGQAIYSVREGSHGINRTLIKDPAVLNKAPLYRCYRVTRYRILSELEDAFLLSSRILLIRLTRDRHRSRTLQIESYLEYQSEYDLINMKPRLNLSSQSNVKHRAIVSQFVPTRGSIIS